METCPECGCELVNPKEHNDPMRRAFFATLRDIWKSLPDHVQGNYSSQEAFRKAALINAGWCDTDMTVCGSSKAAHEVKALVMKLDRYAVTVIKGAVIQTFRARSMAKKACPKAVFQEVADRALHWANLQVGIGDERRAA
jgi:hypothetical protein